MDDCIHTFFNSTFTSDFLFWENKRKTVREMRLNKRIAARLIWQLVIHSCVIFAYIISRRDSENNGFLVGVSLPPPSSRARRVSLALKTLFPFPFKRLPRRLFLTQKRQKCQGGTSRNIGWGCAARFLKPLPYFRPKSLIFPTLFQTWSKIWYPISDLKPWSPARDRNAWQAVTARRR